MMLKERLETGPVIEQMVLASCANDDVKNASALRGRRVRYKMLMIQAADPVPEMLMERTDRCHQGLETLRSQPYSLRVVRSAN
jgi:hypothetical protein